jgi:steroid delta-isomerase-like uncharacterized protein
MSASENKALLTRYFEEVWEKKNPQAARQFLAPDYKRHTSPTTTPYSVEDQIQRLTGIRAAFPDIQVTVEEMVAEDGFITFLSTMRGTHQGDILGVPPTGKKVEVILLDMIRIENGKFVEQWGGPDFFDLLRQLGAKFSQPEGTR